jgi:hypothetical protein
MDQVRIWVEEIWADEGRQIILGDIGTEQFRMMLQLPE